MRRPRGSGCRTCHIRKVDAILLSQPGDGRQIVNGSRLRRARHADQGDDSCLLGAALNNLRLHLIDAHSVIAVEGDAAHPVRAEALPN